MTFDEISGLWFALWQRELERGNEPRVEEDRHSFTLWFELDPPPVSKTMSYIHIYGGTTVLMMEAENFLFEVTSLPNGEVDGTVTVSGQPAPVNPWETIVAYMRRSLEDA